MAFNDFSKAIAEPLPQSQQKQITLPADKWTDEYALNIVKTDWAYAESYRVNAHDWRFRNADELYLGWSAQRFWDGTRIPRSSLGQYVVFQQIMGMLPKIVPQVTSYDNMHFYAENPPDKEEDLIVEAWKELITKQLLETRFREQVNRALHSMGQYGNGVLEVGVEEKEEEYITFDVKHTPTEMGTILHPIHGVIPFPKKVQENFSRKIVRETKLIPYVRYISIKDFYVDPSFEGNVLQDSEHVMTRVYMTAGKLKSLRGQKDWTIPSDDVLYQWSTAKSTANQDVTKQSAELFRYNQWNPALDYSSDPAQKKIAVVGWTSPYRKIFWLQGGDDTKSIIYNQKNSYGMINYFSVPYAMVMDRWHALAMSDVAEGEHRLQQAIINARLDELSLAIHKPTIKRRGITIPGYQLKVRPGVVIETENPDGDIKQLEIDNITQQAFLEVEASQRRVQQITGMTDLAALGTPTSGGNSANRSATGINAQVGATDARINYLVGSIEDLLIEPVINAVIKFNRKFLDLNQASNWLKNDPRFKDLDPLNVMNTRVVAEVRASTRMAARQGFLQLLPELTQTIFNPQFLTLVMQQSQMKLNATEVFRTVMEAVNYSPRNPWLVDMTQQDIQRMNTPPPQAMMDMQSQEAQRQSDESIAGNRMVADLFKVLIKEMFGAHAKHAELDDTYILGLMEQANKAKQIESGGASQGGSGTGKNSGAGK